MKKFTFLMSLFLSVGAMTTSAQTSSDLLDRTSWSVTTSGECTDGSTGHAAAIIDGSNSTYWHSNWGGNDASGDASKTLPQFFVVDLGSEQTFKSILYTPRSGATGANGTATTFKVYVSNTAFQTVDNSHTASAIVTALGDANLTGTFDYTGLGTQPTMAATSSTNLTGRYVMFVVTGSAGQDPGKWASCAEFNLSTASYTNTFHYILEGNEVGTITKDVYDPINNAPSFADYLLNGTVTKNEGKDNDYNVVVTTPFAYTATYDASTAKWYAIDIHNNQANYLWTAGDDGTISVTTPVKGTSTGLTDSYRWAFVGDFTNGFKLYNKATGKTVVLGTDGVSLSDSEGDLFKVSASTASNKANGFCLYKVSGTYLNHQGTSIKTWTSTDEGSTIHVQDANLYATTFAAPYANYDDSNAPEGAIGANSYLTIADNLSAFKSAYTAATAAGATIDQVNALKTINDNIAAATTTTIEAGKYYRLCNKQNNKWLCVRSTNNAQMTTDASANKLASSVVTFDNAETGRFRMKIEGKTFGKYVRDNAAITLEGDDSNSKGSYVVAHVGTDFTFYDMASNNAHSYLHCNNNNGAGNVVGWLADNSTPSHWYVVPATEAEITMNTVGSNTYATAYLPFPVSEVSGAKAYVGTLSADKTTLDMTHIETIPANTGVVLEGTADKATLTIGEATAISGTNALTGSNLDVTIADNGQSNYLVLGASESTIGFYTPASTVTKLAANKAYINASDVTTTGSALKLNFGGDATGIHTIAVDANNGFNAPVFDLSGRRVVAPVKGGVYIQNGKKFIK